MYDKHFIFAQDVRANLQRAAAVAAREQPEPGTTSASSRHPGEGEGQQKKSLLTQESRIMREVAVFSLASHMVWCLWGLKQVFRLE